MSFFVETNHFYLIFPFYFYLAESWYILHDQCITGSSYEHIHMAVVIWDVMITVTAGFYNPSAAMRPQLTLSRDMIIAFCSSVFFCFFVPYCLFFFYLF